MARADATRSARSLSLKLNSFHSFNYKHKLGSTSFLGILFWLAEEMTTVAKILRRVKRNQKRLLIFHLLLQQEFRK